MDQARRFCTQCGYQLVVGRYCTNCGARYRPETDTGSAPPQVGPPPTTATVTPYDVGPPPGPRSVLPWLVGLLVLATAVAMVVVVLVVVGAIGGGVLRADSGDDAAEAPALGGGEDQRTDTSSEVGRGIPLQPTRVTVPDTAPASVDGNGDPVTFRADSMLDTDPRTSWRMPGDGAGSVITLLFDDAVTVTAVGLINGYAKTDPPHDWYAGNRRITSVVWVFDDGTEVPQDLAEVRDLQTVSVGAVETTTIELRILGVTQPGKGPDARDYTAVSEIAITGFGIR